jgi:hypothetical protein
LVDLHQLDEIELREMLVGLYEIEDELKEFGVI